MRAILEARDAARAFVDWCAERVVDAQPRIVGFTSVFQQHLASLALAKRIKALLPETFIVMGGANCEATMGVETVRQFPFVDAVVSGEADHVFADLALQVTGRAPRTALPGVITQATVAAPAAGSPAPTAPAVGDLDALPYPDYTDFFEQFARSRFGRALAAERVRRNLARLLVGRADALHVLRPERRDDGLPQQVGAARARRADAPRRHLPGVRHPGRRQHPRPEVLQDAAARARRARS